MVCKLFKYEMNVTLPSLPLSLFLSRPFWGKLTYLREKLLHYHWMKPCKCAHYNAYSIYQPASVLSRSGSLCECW